MNNMLIRKMENNERAITIIQTISPSRIITERITQNGPIRDKVQDIECKTDEEEFTLERKVYFATN